MWHHHEPVICRGDYTLHCISSLKRGSTYYSNSSFLRLLRSNNLYSFGYYLCILWRRNIFGIHGNTEDSSYGSWFLFLWPYSLLFFRIQSIYSTPILIQHICRGSMEKLKPGNISGTGYYHRAELHIRTYYR